MFSKTFLSTQTLKFTKCQTLQRSEQFNIIRDAFQTAYSKPANGHRKSILPPSKPSALVCTAGHRCPLQQNSESDWRASAHTKASPAEAAKVLSLSALLTKDSVEVEHYVGPVKSPGILTQPET